MVVFVDDIPVFEFLFGVFALVVVVVDDDDDDDDDDSQLLWVVFDVGAARSNIVLFLLLLSLVVLPLSCSPRNLLSFGPLLGVVCGEMSNSTRSSLLKK